MMRPALSRLTRTASAAALLLASGAVLAQQGDQAGGLWLRGSVDQVLSATENANLDQSSQGTTWQSDSRFAFTLSSETRSDYLGLEASGVIRWRDGPGTLDDVDLGFADPSLGLTYRRQVGDSRFTASLVAAERDVTFLDSLDTVLEDTGEVDLTTGTGTRRTSTANVALRFGIDGPVEWGVSAAARQVRYRDIGTANFTDSDRYDLRADTVLSLAPGLTFDGALSYRSLDEDGSPLSEAWGLDLGLKRDLRRGTARLGLDLTDTRTSSGATLSASWSQPLPEGNLAFSLGLTRLDTGTTGATARADYTQTLKNGQITAAFSTALTSNSSGEEIRRNQAQAGYGFALSPLTNIQFNASYVASNAEPTGTRAARASLSAGVSHALDRDWQLGARLTQSQSRSGSGAWARSTGLSITLGRDFATRF